MTVVSLPHDNAVAFPGQTGTVVPLSGKRYDNQQKFLTLLSHDRRREDICLCILDIRFLLLESDTCLFPCPSVPPVAVKHASKQQQQRGRYARLPTRTLEREFSFLFWCFIFESFLIVRFTYISHTGKSVDEWFEEYFTCVRKKE